MPYLARWEGWAMREGEGRRLGLVFGGLLALSLLPFALCWPLPLSDFTNHMARVHIIAHLADRAVLAQYYELHWTLIPNLAFDLLVPPLARVVGTPAAMLGCTALTLALIASGCMALHQALHGRRSWLPLCVFLLLYNRHFLWGFLNYLLALGCMLWVLAAWVAWRAQRSWGKAILFAVPATALFLLHLHPLGVYVICVTALCWQQTWQKTWQQTRHQTRQEHRASRARSPAPQPGHFAAPAATAFAKVLLAALARCWLQFVPAALLFVASATSRRAGESAWGSWSDKAIGLLDLFNNYLLPLDLLTTAALGLLLVGLLWRGRLVLAPGMPGALLVLALLYVAMPHHLISSYGADRRLLIAWALLLVAALRWQPRDRDPRREQRLARGLGVGLALLFGLRLAVICLHWAHAAPIYARLHAGLAAVPAGARVACVVVTPRAPFLQDPPLEHLCNIAVVDKDAFVNALFAEPGQQVLTVRYNADTAYNRNPSQSLRVDSPAQRVGPVLQALPLDRFDWVYVIGDRHIDGPPPARLRPVWREARDGAALFRVADAP